MNSGICRKSLVLGLPVRKGNFMKKILAFGVAAAAFAAFFVSCSNDGGSSGADDGTSEAADFAVGNEISYDGDKYLVLKNDFAENSGGSSRAVVESYSGLFYQNENAQKVRREKIENEFSIPNYVELFNITSKKDKTSAGYGKLEDCYLYLNRSGEKLYTVTQSWQSNTMFGSLSTSEGNEAFNALSENKIREYDPNYLMIESYSAVYGDDLSKKVREIYRYIISNDGKTVDYENGIDKIMSYKDFTEMPDKKSRAVWRYDDDCIKNERYYDLLDSHSSSNFFNFCFFPDGTYRLSSNGDGNINGSTSTSDYRCQLNIRNINSAQLQYRAKITSNDNTTDSKYVTFDYASEESDYISVSSAKTTFPVDGVDGGKVEVPSAVTVKALYSDQNAPLQKYAAVSFKPKLSDDGKIVYKPDVDEFIENYKKDFKALYAAAKK